MHRWPFALVLAGCTSTSQPAVKGTGDGAASSDLAGLGGLDLSGVPVDQAAGPPDLVRSPDLAGGGHQGRNAAIACGNVTCRAPASVCCRNLPFGDGQCIAPGAACGASNFFCDDPSDCDAGELCCSVPGAGSSCASAAACTAKMGDRLCAAQSDCLAGEMCCGRGPSPDYLCARFCGISLQKYKNGIRYLGGDEVRRLHDELLRYRLATWRYKGQGPSSPRHLGFIIDDVGPSPAVAPDGEHVDLYGYASMALAAVQEQARRIEALEKEVQELRLLLAAVRVRARPGR